MPSRTTLEVSVPKRHIFEMRTEETVVFSGRLPDVKMPGFWMVKKFTLVHKPHF